MGLFGFLKNKKKSDADGSQDAIQNTESAQGTTPESTVNKPQAPAQNKAKDGTPPVSKEDLMRQLGRASVELFSRDDNQEAIAKFHELEKKGLAEAGITLGQLYQMKDEAEALKHFRIAADASIAEGAWGAAAILSHEYIPDINGKDAEWYKYCVQAAKGGCPDAMNELGKVYNRKKEYLAAFYWFQMAIYYEHPQAIIDFKQMLKRIEEEKPLESTFSQSVPEISQEESESAKILFEIKTGKKQLDQNLVDALFQLRAMALGSEIIGLFLGHLFEEVNLDTNAKMSYQVIAHSGSVMGMKCLGDMQAYGKGCEQDMQKAFSWYQGAAEAYEKTACFIWSQLFRAKDPEMAAYWLTASYRRGYQPALDLMMKLGI